MNCISRENIHVTTPFKKSQSTKMDLSEYCREKFTNKFWSSSLVERTHGLKNYKKKQRLKNKRKK